MGGGGIGRPFIVTGFNSCVSSLSFFLLPLCVCEDGKQERAPLEWNHWDQGGSVHRATSFSPSMLSPLDAFCRTQTQ